MRRFLVALFTFIATTAWTAEDLTRITGAGGTVYFAWDGESNTLTADQGTGSIYWVGGNPSKPASVYSGASCTPDTSNYHYTVIDNATPAQSAIPGSQKSLKTPYLAACPSEAYLRDTTTLRLPTPVTEYYIRWYQKWTGSTQSSVQQKFVKFGYDDGSGNLQKFKTAHFTMQPQTTDFTKTGVLGNLMWNIDGVFNYGGWTFANEPWVYSTPNTPGKTPHYNGQNFGYDQHTNTLGSGGTDGEIQFDLDRWYCIEIHSKMNSDSSTSDAVVELFIDGTKVWGVSNVKLYDAGTLNGPFPGTNSFELQHVYYNRSNTIDQSTYMDNIVIANRYIGPAVIPGATVPSGRYQTSQTVGLAAGASYCFGAGCNPATPYLTPFKVLQNTPLHILRYQIGADITEMVYRKQRMK